MKTITLYTIAFLQEGNPIIEKHIINEKECQYYIDEGEEFEYAARQLLYENEVLEWEQRFTRCIIITSEQLEFIQGYSISKE
jgi:hypothetical protein